MSEDKWIKRVEASIRKLEEFTPKDRLGLITGISTCWWAVTDSQAGWSNWLKNLQLLNKIPEEMLEAFFETYREHATAFLEFDVEACRRIKDLFPKKEEAKAVDITGNLV